MPTVLTLECPIDGLPLAPPEVMIVLGSIPQDASQHLHVAIAGAVLRTCPNGHTWGISGRQVFERMP